MSQTTESISVPQPEKVRKACALIGTAPTWKLTPWADTSVDIFGLNDGYVLGSQLTGQAAFPRETGHFDLHPFSQMTFRPQGQRQVSAFDVPNGAYLRPDGHLQWLKSRAFPVYVNTVPAGWQATVQAFPRAEIEQKYGTYFTSTPSWMLVWALEQGYTEIHIYGIHLATEWEYVSQRPNFEFWLRHAMDRGVTLILPDKCPLLKSKYVYAYEPKPDLPLQALQTAMAKIKHEGAILQKELAGLGWLAAGRKADLQARLDVLNLELADARQAQHRLQAVIHAA